MMLCFTAALVAAQAAAPEVEVAAEPHHHLTFENKSVRVYNVELPPHGETLMHWHRHDYIYVTLGPTEIVNAVKDKPPVTVKLQDGETRFSAASFAHIARNVTDQPFRNVTIEILEDAALRDSASKGNVKWDEDRALKILEGGTEQILFVKDGIRVTEFELQPGGVVPGRHYAGPHLLVAVSDLNLGQDVSAAHVHNNVKRKDGSSPASGLKLIMKSGDSKWLAAGVSHAITNTGTQPAKFVTLEFP
jgi:quercetin dioxygenase-like cupin family protein